MRQRTVSFSFADYLTRTFYTFLYSRYVRYSLDTRCRSSQDDLVETQQRLWERVMNFPSLRRRLQLGTYDVVPYTLTYTPSHKKISGRDWYTHTRLVNAGTHFCIPTKGLQSRPAGPYRW